MFAELSYHYKTSLDEFLKRPLELNYYLLSKIPMFRAREKLAMAWAAMVPQGVVSQEDFQEQYKIAHPEMAVAEKENTPVVTPAELKARAKANKK